MKILTDLNVHKLVNLLLHVQTIYKIRNIYKWYQFDIKWNSVANATMNDTLRDSPEHSPKWDQTQISLSQGHNLNE